jgi:prefoldin alpha subunit
MVELSRNEAIARLRMDEERLGAINEQAKSVLRALEEITRSRRTLEALPDTEESVLIPMGGTFLPAKANAQKVYTDIGSGVVAEQGRAEAIRVLKAREDDLQATLKQMQDASAKINADALEIRRKLTAKAQPDIPVISG